MVGMVKEIVEGGVPEGRSTVGIYESRLSIDMRRMILGAAKLG